MRHANKLVFSIIVILLAAIILFVPIGSDPGRPDQSLFELAANFTGLNIRDEPQNLTLILAGDVMLGRTVMTTSLDHADPTYPFLKVAPLLNAADLVLVNLESPFVSGCQRTYEGLVFCADPTLVQGLVHAGINVVSLANNHSRNYADAGLNETVNLLISHGIQPTGLGKLVTKDVRGLKVGFLGFDFLSRSPKAEDFELITQSQNQVDLLILSVHWGIEYTDQPTDAQRQWALQMVEAGADVIAGHHPHWVQEVARVNSRPVYYSLGNFVFDQMWSEKTRQGLVVRLTFDDQGQLLKEELLKTYISSWAQPEFVDF